MAFGRRRIQVSHIEFILGFSVLLYVFCNAVNIEKLAKWFYVKDELNNLALAAYLLAGLCLFIALFALLAHRHILKPWAMVIAGLSAAVTYFIAKYNVAVDSSMVLNAVHTDATEMRQLLSMQMIPYAAGLIAVPAAMIWFVDVTFDPPRKYLLASLKLIAISVIVAVASLYLNYTAILRAGNVSNKYIVHSLVPINFLSSSISVLSRTVKPYLAPKRKEVAIVGSVGAGDLVVVLAIGETSRRKNFSLYGYTGHITNPALQPVDGLHLLNGLAKHGTTLDALPEILEKKDIKLTAVTSKLGIPTSCYVNYTLYDNCEAVGETAVSNCAHEDKCYDEDVIPLLAGNLKSYTSGHRFVVLHLGGGSHGPTYIDRYPPEFQRFQPICKDADVANQCSLEQVYNSYDNSILYVDHVLNGIIGTLESSHAPYVLIYLSDHGESLLEDGRMFHGMPPGIALPPEQAQIPLIVKSSVPINVVKRDEYSQPDVFDSVLDLFSIQTEMFDKSGAFIRR